MSAVRIGLVGCGRWGRLILRDLVGLGCDVAVASVSASSRKAALAGGARVAVQDVSRLPGELDGYVVAVKTTAHYRVLCELLPFQKPIFCEKPLTAYAEEARDIATRAPHLVFVMDKWRYHPAIDAMAEIARSGHLGAVRALHSSRLQWGTHHTDIDVVWTVAPHELSIMLHVLGYLPVPRAALGEWIAGRLQGMTALLGDEVTATTHISACFPTHFRDVQLVCDEGVVHMLDPYADHINLYRYGTDVRPTQLPTAEPISISTEFPLLRELRQFRGYLRGGPPPLSDARIAAEVVETIVRIRALAAGKPSKES